MYRMYAIFNFSLQLYSITLSHKSLLKFYILYRLNYTVPGLEL
jgi:hypothetical protein